MNFKGNCTFVAHWAFAALVLVASLPAWASGHDLSHYVQAALNFDPTLKAANAQRDATLEQRAQGIGQILPQLYLQASKSRNVTDTSTVVNGNQNSPHHFEYPSDSKALILRQPLVRPRLVFNAIQGNAKAVLGEAQHEIAWQKAIGRAAAAHSAFLAQFENSRAAQEEMQAAEMRLRQGEMLRQAGGVSDVELAAARSSLSQAKARSKEANAGFAAARRDLAASSGVAVPDVPVEVDWPKSAERLLAHIRASLWIKADLELDENPEVRAQQTALEVATLEMRKVSSDHSPTLDLVFSLSEGTSAQDIAINQFTRTRAVGIQFNLPIYSGGVTQSVVREQTAMRDKARFDLDATRLRIENDRNRTRDEVSYRFDLVDSGLAELDSATLALRQVTQGAKRGINSDVDIADRRAKRMRALAALARNVTDLTIAYVQLLVSLGNLDVDIIEPVSAALAVR